MPYLFLNFFNIFRLHKSSAILSQTPKSFPLYLLKKIHVSVNPHNSNPCSSRINWYCCLSLITFDSALVLGEFSWLTSLRVCSDPLFRSVSFFRNSSYAWIGSHLPDLSNIFSSNVLKLFLFHLEWSLVIFSVPHCVFYDLFLYTFLFCLQLLCSAPFSEFCKLTFQFLLFSCYLFSKLFLLCDFPL